MRRRFLDKYIRTTVQGPYNHDGLWSVHNHDFMSDPSFCRAYERGCCAANEDYRWHWRVHIGLWAAFSARKLDGDFVECGVNYGCMSSAIMEFLDWNSLKKTFYLLDTFAGLDPQYVSSDDLNCAAKELLEKDSRYVKNIETVKENFSQWQNIRIIQGSIPETLNQVDTRKVAFLHIDMNCSPPEVAAMRFFWDRLLPGAFVLFDDYAFRGFKSQKDSMDCFAREKGVMIASLPTGQGLLLKPPSDYSVTAEP